MILTGKCKIIMISASNQYLPGQCCSSVQTDWRGEGCCLENTWADNGTGPHENPGNRGQVLFIDDKEYYGL